MASKRLFVLASSSPRRRELLGIAGFMFSTVKVDVEESPRENEHPRAYTLRLAEAKAQAAAHTVIDTPIIIAADTTVVDGDEIMGKPLHAKEAERMLKQLRGRTHQVYSAVALLDMLTGAIESDVAVTDVPMRDYSDEEIIAYIQSGDPFDKAGGYAIQHPEFRPAATRTGCYANVIGLPLCHLLRLMRRMGLEVKQDIPYLCQTALDYECGVFSSILRT